MSPDFRRILGYSVLGLIVMYGGFLCVVLGTRSGISMFLGTLILILVVGFVLLVVAGVAASLVSLVVGVLPVRKVPLSYNLRNLLVRWKTTAVIVVAFTLVIALLTVMLAFVTGMNRLTESSGQPGNVIILSDGATDEAFSNLPPGVSITDLENRLQQMVLTVRRDGKKVPLATKEVYVIVNQPIPNQPPGERKRRMTQVRGVYDAEITARVHDLELLPGGQWLSPAGARNVKRERNGTVMEETLHEVLVGEGVAGEFGKDFNQGPIQPGQEIKIGPLDCIVVGILKSAGSTFGSEVWMRDDTVCKTFGRKDSLGAMSYSSYVVRTTDAQTAREFAKGVTETRRGDMALQAMPETDYYARLGETSRQFFVAILFVGIIIALGGALGVMIAMFAAISQRTKDIGVLRLLGYQRWQILMSFMLESVLIGLIGGVLGCTLGYLADGWTASSIVSSGQGGGGKSVVLRLVVDGFVIGVAMIFTVVMGAVGGLLPSVSAMRLRPLESLR